MSGYSMKYLILDSIFTFFIASFAQKLNCDFEDGMCLWRHETYYTNGRQWQLSPQTPFGCEDNLCPKYNNFFLLVTSKTLNENGSFVRISHFRMSSQPSGECFISFKYIAFGSKFAKIIVGSRIGQSIQPETILVIHSSQSMNWKVIDVPFITDSAASLIIDGKREDLSKNGNSGFLAIDEISFSEGCDTERNEDIISYDKVSSKSCEDCDYNDDYYDGNYDSNGNGDNIYEGAKIKATKTDKHSFMKCTFENISTVQEYEERCGWMQDFFAPKGAYWVVANHYTAPEHVDLHPEVDTTMNSPSGSYLLLAFDREATYKTPVIIRLISPVLKSSKETCTFSFSYEIFDKRSEYVLNIRRDGQLTIDKLLWIDTMAGGMWRKAKVIIGRNSKPFRLVFTVKKSPIFLQSTLALDDLIFDEC
ncbi:MAM and LDL-receptor class A domain-containing protein 2-like protein [Dinothrombium tinctorium]|uniref:MAM and LDL-receptor class A domain-containing protein 2-like protein n=1 Tax=Dinothrombium tinctorium TaxID=1965070 RepID=A0A3S3Q221_9ACAR|nr:MAM and LDL-receptor class A domain-containing protein 2-like protein [Dinothrombium tinctorium]